MNAPQHLRAWLQARYTGEGYFCLGSIDGDPSIPKGTPGYSPMVQEWYEWPREAGCIISRYVQLAERGLNLYAGHCLHTEKQRVYPTALPSDWLWIDDAPADLPCTELVQSSEGSYQAWFHLDQALSAQERSDLQRAIKQATSGADNCSSDAVHMVRVPFGYNTKRHGRFAVHLARQNGPIFSVEELRQRYPLQTKQRPAHETESLTHWEVLPIGADLLASPRWQTIIDKRSQLKTILIEHGRVSLPRGGHLDDSDSAQVAVLVSNFLSAHLPYREIRAALLHLRPSIRPGIDLARYQADVDRLLVKYTPTNYKPEPTRWLSGEPSAAVEPLPAVEPARRGPGRPVGSQEARRQKLLRQLATIEPDDFGRRIYRRDHLAGVLGVSERTIAADLSALVGTEQITRGQIAGNGAGFVILTSDFRGAANYSKRVETTNKIRGETDVQDCSIPTPETSDEILSSNKEALVHTAPPAVATSPAAAGAQGGGCVLTQAQAPLLALVRRALDMAGLNPTTGELRNVRFPTVARFVEQHAPGRYSRERIHRAYKTVLQERARERELARLQTMPRKKLEGMLRWCDRLLMKPDQPKAAMARVQRAQILTELERREREQVLVATHPLDAFAVGPVPGKYSDMTLFDLIDRAERAPVTRRAVREQVRSSPTPEPEGWRMIARLKQRKESIVQHTTQAWAAMYSARAIARRRCTGTTRAGQPCRCWALWNDPRQLCVRHARGPRGPQRNWRERWAAGAEKTRYTPCMCVAYPYPHRPGGGVCCWPDAPLFRVVDTRADRHRFCRAVRRNDAHL